MKKKKLVILILILYLISPIGISIWTIPNTFNFVTNDDLEESPRFKIETPKLSSGHRWILDGLGICTAYDIQEDPEIASDGEGGALITWVDLRRGWYDIYAQKVDSNGDEQWSKNGVPASLVGGQRQKPQICSDGAGGAIIVWIDNDDGHYKIYAQRINSI